MQTSHSYRHSEKLYFHSFFLPISFQMHSRKFPFPIPILVHCPKAGLQQFEIVCFIWINFLRHILVTDKPWGVRPCSQSSSLPVCLDARSQTCHPGCSSSCPLWLVSWMSVQASGHWLGGQKWDHCEWITLCEREKPISIHTNLAYYSFLNYHERFVLQVTLYSKTLWYINYNRAYTITEKIIHNVAK